MTPVIRLMAIGSLLFVLETGCFAQQSHSTNYNGAGTSFNLASIPYQASVPSYGAVAYGPPRNLTAYQPRSFGSTGSYGGFNLGYWPGFDAQTGPGGLMLPNPETASSGSPLSSTSTPPRRQVPNRADELMAVGDRSFRAGNLRRAQDRYNLAIKADRISPTPQIHLAQVEIVRGDYAAAAANLRAAVAAGTGAGWLLETPDIESMYGEPADFHKQVTILESYLQTHPEDRNGWFVLGAQQYFSGRHRAAADTFLRLSDREPDAALVAFRDANTVANRSTTLNNKVISP